MAEKRPKPTGAWATAQLCLAVAAIAWGVLLFVAPGPEGPPTKEFPREAFWPGATVAAGVFFVAAGILFGRDHPDARIVGLFGAAIFLATNATLAFERYRAQVTCHDALGNPYSCHPFQGERIGAMVAATVAVTLLEIVLLWTVTVYERRVRREAEEAKRDAIEKSWHS